MTLNISGNGSIVGLSPAGVGISSADVVGYNPAGTGAVATTVQTKLRESVSVKDFGAVGDGVTDDTAAIQAAFAASTDISLPPGNYILTGQITPQANTRVFGHGIIIVGGTNIYPIQMTQPGLDWSVSITVAGYSGVGILFSWLADDLYIHDCTLDGGTIEAGGSRNWTMHGIRPKTTGGVSKLTVRNVKLTKLSFGYFRSNTDTGSVSNICVNGCHFTTNFGQDWSLNSINTQTSDVRICNNRFENNLGTTIGGYSHNVSITGGKGVVVSGNYIHSIEDDAIHMEENTEDVTVNGNTIYALYSGIQLLDNNVGGSYRIPKNIVISGNTFVSLQPTNTTSTENRGVRLSFDPSGNSPAENVIVSNNVISGFNIGIQLAESPLKGAMVHNNQIVDCDEGIVVNYPSSKVRNNVLRRCAKGVVNNFRPGGFGRNDFEATTVAMSSTKDTSMNGWTVRLDSVALTGSATTTPVLMDRATRIIGRLTIAINSSDGAGTNRRFGSFNISYNGSICTTTSEHEYGSGTVAFNGAKVNVVGGQLIFSVNNTGASTTSDVVQADFDGLYIF
jgi:hypothetical protein